MSLIPRDVAVAAGRRLYEPEAKEGGNMQFFSETLNPEEASRYNSFVTVYTPSKREKMMKSGEDEQEMAKGHGETVLLCHLWSLLPNEWVQDCVIHYAVKAMPDLLGITDPAVAFFPSFFFTKLFQEGKSDEFGAGGDGDFNYGGG